MNEYQQENGECMKTFLQPLQSLAEIEEIEKQQKVIVEYWR